MSWRTSALIIGLRHAGRALGINRLIATATGSQGYERAFQAAMAAAIRPGDTIWDVGANVGVYSTLFSKLAGPTGHVVAWEPSPSNLVRLCEAVSSLHNISVQAVGLARKKGSASFQQGLDDSGASSRVVDANESRPSDTLVIQLASGDELISSGAVPFPNVIKIDTEGLELDVLLGLAQTLRDENLRVVCVEVHFGILRERNLPGAPSEIEKLLSVSGFRVAWPDSSHIIASRPS